MGKPLQKLFTVYCLPVFLFSFFFPQHFPLPTLFSCYIINKLSHIASKRHTGLGDEYLRAS